MNYKRLAINDFKNRMRSCVFWNRQIINLNQEIEDINYALEGTSAMKFNFDGIELEPDSKKLHKQRIALYDKQNILIKEIEKYENYFRELSEQFNQLSNEMQEIIFYVYVLEKKISTYATKKHMSDITLKRKIDEEIISVLPKIDTRYKE